MYCMSRLISVILICISLVGISCKQQPKDFRFNEMASPKNDALSLLQPLGWTSDYEHIFSEREIAELDSIIGKFEKETSIEIAILTFDSTWTSQDDFMKFTHEVANSWGVGKKDKKNGIMIAMSAGLRRIRILNGFGIEAVLSDEETKKILDEIMLPEFREGKYFNGIKNGLLAIINKLREKGFNRMD